MLQIEKYNKNRGDVLIMSAFENGKLVRIHSGSSNGYRRHAAIEDISFIISGTGKAICNGMESIISAGAYKIFKGGSDYRIINTGNEDLVMISYIQ